jgi:hypothetical protein
MRVLTLPLTLVRLPAELALAVAKRAGETALSAARVGYDLLADRGAQVYEPPAPPPRARPAPSPNGAEPVAAPPPPPPPPPAPPPPAPEPAHVSEEPELVAEFAEAGAEEGAGAEIHVDEPWPGYDGMRAVEIRDRLTGGGAELAAAVSLYEASRKGRRSVLEAAARGMRA